VETAGDCYIVAGALMVADDEGFMTLDFNGDASHGARNVVNFAQVGRMKRRVGFPAYFI